jgi:1,2-diacylglycerol 3-beta-galactosyltransferase
VSTPIPLLFLVADTGGGHRAAARAVIQALHREYPDTFDAMLCDPLGGPRAAGLLRRVTGLYGPSIRWAPWTWGAVYYGCDSRPAVWVLQSTLMALAHRPVADAVARHRPAAIVSFHPLTGGAAVRARDREAPQAPVVAVVTDLVNVHAAWRGDNVDRIVVPRTALRWPPDPRAGADLLGCGRRIEIGIPVAAAFAAGPLGPSQRAELRRSLRVAEQGFLILLTGGGEGAGGIARRAAAILRRLGDVHVVALCGRNRGLRRRLDAAAARYAGRLTVHGFVDNMAEWLRCADVVVAKAGPGTIAEATCCGAALLLTSHVPGQERGNTEFVVRTGAGRHAPTVRQLIREIVELRRNPAALDAMRVASARLGQPTAAADIAALVAGLAAARVQAQPDAPGIVSPVDDRPAAVPTRKRARPVGAGCSAG